MTSIELFIEELKELKLIREDLKTTLSLLIGKYKEIHHKETMNAIQKGMEIQEKENNRIGFRERNGLLPQQEISDEEIEDASLNIEHYNLDMIVIERIMWGKGAKWYREQLKNKQ